MTPRMFKFVVLLVFGVIAVSGRRREKWRSLMSDLLDNKIVGGHDAAPGEFPWAVSLRFADKSFNPPEGHYCGGSVVTVWAVATACHCAVSYDAQARQIKVFPTRDKLILAGTIKSDPIKGGGQLRKMKAMIVHPKCEKDPNKGRGWTFDYAYAVADRPFSFNTNLKPLPMSQSDARTTFKQIRTLVSKKTVCYTSGFGYTAPTDKGDYTALSMVLKTIELNIIDFSECGRSLCEYHEAYCNISLEKKVDVCAQSATLHGDACKGDSGSALVCEGVGIGVLSWGPKCGEGPDVIPSMYALAYYARSFYPDKDEGWEDKSVAMPRGGKGDNLSNSRRCHPFYALILLMCLLLCIV